MPVERNEAEIEKVIERLPYDGEPSKFSGMSYEDGIRIALDWVMTSKEDAGDHFGEYFDD